MIHTKREKTTYILYFIAFTYFITVFMITGVIEPWNIHNAHNYSYIPFIDFDSSYFLLNFVLFLPAGCFLHLLLNRKNNFSFSVILIGVVIIISIEFIQFLFTGRLADIDDVISNSFGLIIGYFIFYFTYKIIQSRCKYPIGLGTFSIFISFIGLIFGFPYRYPLCLGDMIFVHWDIPIWSGNQGSSLSFSGIHYSLYVYLFIQVIAFLISLNNPNQLGKLLGKIMSSFGILFLFILIIINLMV